MIESKQRELREQLEDSESEESYSDDDMDGSPTFLEPLTRNPVKRLGSVS